MQLRLFLSFRFQHFFVIIVEDIKVWQLRFGNLGFVPHFILLFFSFLMGRPHFPAGYFISKEGQNKRLNRYRLADIDLHKRTGPITHTHTLTHTHTHTHIYIYIYKHWYAHIFMNIFAWIRYQYAHLIPPSHTQIHTNTHTHIYIYI